MKETYVNSKSNKPFIGKKQNMVQSRLLFLSKIKYIFENTKTPYEKALKKKSGCKRHLNMCKIVAMLQIKKEENRSTITTLPFLYHIKNKVGKRIPKPCE